MGGTCSTHGIDTKLMNYFSRKIRGKRRLRK